MRAIFWTLAALMACAAAAESTDCLKSKKKIVCYFGSWAVYREKNGKFDIEGIDPNLCTHLVYTFIGLGSNADIKIIDPYADLSKAEEGGGLDGYSKFNKLRDANPNLKTMIAIGGWNEGSVKYSKLVGSSKLRTRFVKNAVKFTKKYGFNGMDLDWEYPNQRGGVKADKENFVLLLKELREKFDEEGLILSAAVAAAEVSAKKSYIIPKIAEYLHYISIMAYDLHTAADHVTGNNAPLYPGSWETGQDRLLNVQASVKYWLSQGAPAEKLILGVPLYGRTYTLDDPKNNGIGAPAQNVGAAGPYTKEPGSLGYNEICEAQQSGDWKTVFQEEQRVPYTFKGDQWVSYDDPQSIEEKAKFINENELGGAMVWSIETDDFRGICGDKNPLISILYSILRKPSSC